ncbi:hypothetical protein [Leptolyngbya ohadii]|uniref:hypothetical protein n=1 Tax=Leptolyngbya ohadii TaxID=1962290 RepID=UPI000B59CC77|nr:hypothetical protein [Leptolyngbya ohadii]
MTENLTIADISAGATHYIGQVITLRGQFQDWQIAQCEFPEQIASHPRTRSDWLIRTGNECAYVTQGRPQDLSPMNPEDLGHGIELEAEIIQGEDGKIYLAYRNSKRL